MNAFDRAHRGSMFTLIATGLISVIAIALWQWRHASNDPMRPLVEASAKMTYRDLQPRLTGGFRWAPLRPRHRGVDDDAIRRNPILASAASTITKLRGDDSTRSRHTMAIAQLLTGDVRHAADALQRSASTTNEATAWSDLAASRYIIGSSDDDPSQLADALAAADTAIHRDARIAEAHFNRALILEKFGLRDQARDEWEECLRVDGGSDWTPEAREHLQHVQPLPPFRQELDRHYARLARDAELAHAFARQYPEDARRWGETEILGRWATAESAGDHADAARHLAVARGFGAQLSRDGGDGMLAALVAAIDAANDAQRRALVAAHLAFREGQKVYGKDDQPAKAEKILLRAADAFRSGGSPGELLALYFATTTAFTQGRADEAYRRHLALLAQSPPPFLAQRAQVQWQIGNYYFAAARWGPCIEAYDESVAIFEKLEEHGQAANVRQALATAYERIGDPDEAWKHRMILLRDLGQRPGQRLETLLRQLGRTEATNRDWPAAISFFDLAVDMGRRIDEPLIQIETLTHRAMVRLRMNAPAAARTDIADARSRLARVSDAGYRALLDANIKEVEALLATSPSVAIDLLTPVIAYHATEGRRMYLPELYLERGRAYEKLNDSAHAASDYEAGVSELETTRESLGAGEARWGIYYDADELLSSAITLALANGDAARAFSYAERGRARSLLDSLGVRSPAIAASDLQPGTLLIEYAAQPKSLVIFTVDAQGARATTRAVDRDALVTEVARFTRAAAHSDNDAVRREGRELYEQLIEPVEHELSAAQSIVFVPDPKLGSIPFAALTDASGRYLIEKEPLTVSPSAAVFMRLAKEHRPKGNRNLLLVSGTDDIEPLTAAGREASAVETFYPHVTHLTRDAATRDAFVRSAPSADAIHFTGHAVSSNEIRRDGYLHLAGGDLDLKEIAAMPLRRTSLVVLAACDTAAGRVRATEGTISVARAFVAAGVPSVVATLWPIEDERAADFFPLFHRYAARGLPPAVALRAAQLDSIRHPEGSVALWAAVQLIGK